MDGTRLAPNRMFSQHLFTINIDIVPCYVHIHVHFGIKSYAQLALINKTGVLHPLRSSVGNILRVHCQLESSTDPWWTWSASTAWMDVNVSWVRFFQNFRTTAWISQVGKLGICCFSFFLMVCEIQFFFSCCCCRSSSSSEFSMCVCVLSSGAPESVIGEST